MTNFIILVRTLMVRTVMFNRLYIVFKLFIYSNQQTGAIFGERNKSIFSLSSLCLNCRVLHATKTTVCLLEGFSQFHSFYLLKGDFKVRKKESVIFHDLCRSKGDLDLMISRFLPPWSIDGCSLEKTKLTEQIFVVISLQFPFVDFPHIPRLPLSHPLLACQDGPACFACSSGDLL